MASSTSRHGMGDPKYLKLMMIGVFGTGKGTNTDVFGTSGNETVVLSRALFVTSRLGGEYPTDATPTLPWPMNSMWHARSRKCSGVPDMKLYIPAKTHDNCFQVMTIPLSASTMIRTPSFS